MPWAKLDDHFHDHAKVITAGHEAVGLFALCLTWACGQQTDGKVPAHVPRRFAGGRSKHLCKVLVEAGLFDLVEDGYVIHDFLDYNPSRSRSEAVSTERSEAGRKGAQARWGHGKTDGNSHGNSHGKTVASEKQDDAPARPDPSPTTSRSRKKPATPTPDLFPITPAMAAWGAKNAPLVVEPARETERFLDHHRANDARFSDWTAAWRKWMSNAQKYAAERPGAARAQALAAKQAEPTYDPHKEWMYQ